MQTVSKRTAIMLVLLLVFLCPPSLAAAPFELSVTAKTAFDKMTVAADRATSLKLTSQYAELQAVQKQTIEWDLRIDKLHYQNEEAEIASRKRIKDVDADKLSKLEATLVQTKKKYEPLFVLYDTLNQQLNLAKSLKNKGLASILSPQVEAAKVAVQLAKADIRSKDTALRTAKASTTKTTKDFREHLSEIDPIEVKIKASKSVISNTNKQFTTEASILNQVVRKGDSTATLSSFISMLTHTKQINEQKQKIYAYEQQVMSLITKVDARIVAHK